MNNQSDTESVDKVEISVPTLSKIATPRKVLLSNDYAWKMFHQYNYTSIWH